MYKYITILLLFCSQLNANLRVDYSVLKDENNETILYVNYSYFADNFEIISSESSYQVSTKAKFTLKSKYDTISFESQMTNNFENEPQNRIVIGVESIKVKNTNYKLDLEISDLNSDKSLTKNLRIKSFKLDDNYSISEPIIAYNIIPKNEANYDKNLLIDDFFVLPNPSRNIEGNFLELNLFSKVYNNNLNLSKMSAIISVINSRDLPVLTDTFEVINNSILAKFDLSAEATGVYTTKIDLFDMETNNELSKYISNRFYLVNQNVAPQQVATFTENQEFDMSEYSTMNEETVDREFRKMRYILTKYEMQQYERLDLLKAKQRALFTYWKYRDPDTTTYLNERKVDFDKAVKYANTYFDFSNVTEGWKTDRGRVLLQYGFPTETDKFEEKEDMNACEIWYYGQIRGGVYFYFVDMGNFNDYRLVHSTMINEIYDRDWRERYNPAIDQTDFLERKSTLDDERDF